MSHLTVAERYTTSVMLKENFSRSDIGKAIGKDKSVISRELKRNSDLRSDTYDDDLAHRKYQKRIKEKPKYIRFVTPIQKMVELHLSNKLSSEQIVGICKKDGIECVSAERIYQHIWEDKKKKGLLF